MKARSRTRRAIAARVAALTLAAVALTLAVWYLWRPGHIVWARNAYGMTAVGAWSGFEGFSAFMAYWFFELRGRTVVTVAALAGWMAAAWLSFPDEPAEARRT